MIKRYLALCLLLYCVMLSGCGGESFTKPLEIENAERYTKEGVQAFSKAEWEKAQWLFTHALSLYEGIDDRQGVLYSRINLAEVALSVQNYSQSLHHLELATVIAKKKSLKNEQARITLLYTLIALQKKQIDQAETSIQSLLPAIDELTPSTLQIAAISTRTKIAFIQKKDEIIWVNRYANALKSPTTYPIDFSFRLLRFQALLMQQQGQYVEAEANLQQALIGYKTNSNRSGIAETLLELGHFYQSQKKWQEARDYFNRSNIVFSYLRNSKKVKQITENLLKIENNEEK